MGYRRLAVLLLMLTHAVIADDGMIEGVPYAPRAYGSLLFPANPRACDRLRIYFPGHAQELGLAARVPSDRVLEWHRVLLSEESEYALAAAIIEGKCPVLLLADSESTLSPRRLRSALRDTGTSSFELLIHSGGYVGLEASLRAWSANDLAPLAALQMLDSFYDASTAQVLRSKLGRAPCAGFTTPHNRARFEANFAKLCPATRHFRSGHKAHVREFF